MSWFSSVMGSRVPQSVARRQAVVASAVELLEDRRLLSASCAPYSDYNPCQPRGCIDVARSGKRGDNCEPQTTARGSFGKGNDCRPDDWCGPVLNRNGQRNGDSSRGKDKGKDRCDDKRRDDRCDNGPLLNRGGRDGCDNGFDSRKKNDRKDDDCRRDDDCRDDQPRNGLYGRGGRDDCDSRKDSRKKDDYRRKDDDCRREDDCRRDNDCDEQPQNGPFLGRGGNDDCDRNGEQRSRKDRCDDDKRGRRDRKDRCDDRKDDCQIVTFRSGKNGFCDRPRGERDCEPQQQPSRWSSKGGCFSERPCQPTWCDTVQLA